MIQFRQHSGIYTLTVEQRLPIGLDDAWEFFSTPGNLAEITPSYMGFHITSKTEGKMYAGQIITYRIGLLPGIKSNWVTEITHVDPNVSFVDEQRFGPYAMWHHEHIFEVQEEGVRMIDRVSYKPPFGILGRIVHAIFIKRKLKEIFLYRYATLSKKFNYRSSM